MPPEAVLETLRLAWTTLQSLHIPAAVVGGLAMTTWKRARFTKDVDLLIALPEAEAKAVFRQLSAVGFRAKGREALIRLPDGTRFLQLVHDDALLDIQVDLLLANTPFHLQAIERRIALPESELGFAVDVVSCEDLIVLKLLAGRILDRADAAELLRLNRDTLDLPYLTGWVRQLRLQRAFAEAWGDAFPHEAPPA
jgi:hypothetical protein